jgi:dihydrofolate reductase
VSKLKAISRIYFRVIAGFAISLDGYLEGPNGEYDWMNAKPDPNYDYTDSAKHFDTFLIARKTYDKLVSFNDPSFKQYHNYVFSRTIKEGVDCFIIVDKDLPSFIQELKSGQGKEIALYGGADLLTSFLDLGLVDEISMTVIPII